MCTGVALDAGEFADEFMGRHGLRRRVHRRGGAAEVRFLFRDRERLLPAWRGGELILARWGSRRDEDRRLPATGWTWRASVAEGKWAAMRPEEVIIPCQYAWEGGVWYQVRQGPLGVLVRDAGGSDAVYIQVRPATHYYKVMTRGERMPVFVGEVI